LLIATKKLDNIRQITYFLFELQERLLPEGKGRRRGKPGRIREKLSGKRTAASTDPGKRWAFVEGPGHRRGNSRHPQGIISQVKRQEEGDTVTVAFLLFIL
jgi:hypothetical protein